MANVILPPRVKPYSFCHFGLLRVHYLQEALLVFAARARDEHSVLPKAFCSVC